MQNRCHNEKNTELNSTYYIFGDLGEGYTQYPYDGTEVTFRRVASSSSRRKQCFVRREGERMYYGFLHRLEAGGHYVGVCLLEQGVMVRDVRPLMRLLEDNIENMAIADRIIGLDDRGNYVAHVSQLVENRDEVERVSEVFMQRLQNISYLWCALPQLNFGTSVEEIRLLSLDNDPEVIARACCNNGYLLLQPGDPIRRNPEPPKPSVDPTLLAAKETELRESLARETATHEALVREQSNNQTLQNELKAKEASLKEAEKQLQTLRKKKPGMAWRVVRTLLILSFLAVGGYWGYGQVMNWMNTNSDQARSAAKLNNTNRLLNDEVGMLQEQLRQKEVLFADMRGQLALKDTVIEALMDEHNLRQPLVPKSLYVTRESQDYAGKRINGTVHLLHREPLRVHFGYVGMREGVAHVQLNITTPSNSFWFISAPHIEKKSISVHPGSQCYNFDLWSPGNDGYWERGKYIVELILDGEVVRTKEFRIE